MTDYIDFIDENGNYWTKTNRFREAKETIAAQGAVIEKLREALNNHHEIGLGRGRDKSHSLAQLIISGYKHGPLCRITQEALAIPTDSTQILDEVRKQERERCAKVCEDQANEPECTERAMYCAEAIRAME